MLIVFGGIEGINYAVEADEKLKANKPEQIFSHICESKEFSDYGSRSIRLEVTAFKSKKKVHKFINFCQACSFNEILKKL